MTSKSKGRSVSKRRSAEAPRAASTTAGNLRFDPKHTPPQDEKTPVELTSQLHALQQENEQLRDRLGQAEQKLTLQSQLLQSFQAEARTDPLTGLLNRRAFDEDLVRRMSAWRRRAIPFSLLWVDVDHFKMINDRHGHAAGDELLRQVARTLAATFRDMDLVARVGGEEFAAVLPVTNANEAIIPAERLRRTLATFKFEVDGRALAVSISVGTTAVQPDDDVATVVRRADQALYAAKSAGRNVVWSAELGRIEPTSSVR